MNEYSLLCKVPQAVYRKQWFSGFSKGPAGDVFVHVTIFEENKTLLPAVQPGFQQTLRNAA